MNSLSVWFLLTVWGHVIYMLKFEIRNIIVDEEILGEVHLEFVNNIGVDTVKMREIEMQEQIRLK